MSTARVAPERRRVTGRPVDVARCRMFFGTDADDAHRFVLGLLGWMLEGLDETGRAGAVEALRSTAAAHETDRGVIYESAAWMIRATRL